jgi:hypothetical protein
VWPTVPGWRLFIGSTNATGVLSFLNTRGILMQVHEPHGNPRAMQWDIVDAPISILDGHIFKTVFYPPLRYSVDIVFLTIWGPLESGREFLEQRCNVTHPLPEAGVEAGPLVGSTGNDLRVLQVNWDETEPPGGWPP